MGKALNEVRRLKMMSSCLIHSLPSLRDVIILLIFFMFVFALVGVTFYQGKFNNYCMYPNTTVPPTIEQSRLCSKDPKWGKQCRKRTNGTVCSDWNNPDRLNNFDDFGSAFLIMYQCLTTCEWGKFMEWVEQSAAIYHVFYFIIVIFFLPIFALNLVVAVLFTSYTYHKHLLDQETEKYEQRLLD